MLTMWLFWQAHLRHLKEFLFLVPYFYISSQDKTWKKGKIAIILQEIEDTSSSIYLNWFLHILHCSKACSNWGRETALLFYKASQSPHQGKHLMWLRKIKQFYFQLIVTMPQCDSSILSPVSWQMKNQGIKSFSPKNCGSRNNRSLPPRHLH